MNLTLEVTCISRDHCERDALLSRLVTQVTQFPSAHDLPTNFETTCGPSSKEETDCNVKIKWVSRLLQALNSKAASHFVRARNPFTHDEDILLAKYIATHNPGHYGRSGNALYKKLVANVRSGSSTSRFISCFNVQEDQRWRWSQRHTWQSWRGRYTDHTDWFDQAIAKYQAKKNVAVEESETSKSTRAAGRSDVKRKRKQQDDDVVETVEVKPEKKRQKLANTAEERVITTHEESEAVKKADVRSQQQVPVEVEVKQEGKQRKDGTAGEERIGEGIATQVVRQVELGTALTNATNGRPLITADIPSKVSKLPENSDAKGKWKEEDTMVGIGAKQEEEQGKATTPPTNVTEEDDPLFTPNGRANEEAEDEGQVTSVDEGEPVQEPGSR